MHHEPRVLIGSSLAIPVAPFVRTAVRFDFKAIVE